MRSVLIALLCLACLTPIVSAEQITNLPQDQDKFFTSVVGDANDGTYQRLLTWFDTNPDLKQLKDSTFFNAVTTDDPIYSRYAPNTKMLPMVRVQDAQGNVLAQIAGDEIPTTAERLYNCIGVQVQLRLPHLKHRHRPQPKPESPKPVQPIIVHVDAPPQPLSDSRELSFRVKREIAAGLILICAGALIAGLVASRKKSA